MLKKKVLIADTNQKQMILLKDNLKSRGFNTLTALDGVKALELILSELPEVIVLGVDLPIIDGERLSAIVRSNPKTANTPIIFLSNSLRKIESYQPFKDVLLIKPVELNDIIHKVNSFYQKIERIEKVSRLDKEIEGNISQIPLVDLIQILSMNKKNGVIVLTRNEVKGFVYFKEGNIVNANLGKIEGEKAFFRLLSWGEGKFEFVPTKISTLIRIQRSTDSLIMEGMRQLDEWEKMKETFPSPDSFIRLKVSSKELPKELSGIEQEVLLLLEFYPRLGDIVDNCTYPDYEVYVTVHNLLKEGIIEIYKKEESPKKLLKQPFLLPDQIFKLRGIITYGQKSIFNIERGKILIIATRNSTLKSFINSCKDITGFSLNKDFLYNINHDNIPIGYLGSIVLSETVEIVFYVVPHNETFKPFWNIFIKSALGVILLFDGGGIKLRESLRDSNLYFYNKYGKPVAFILFSPKKANHQLISKIVSEFKLNKEDSLFIISPNNTKGGFLPIQKILELSIK